MSVLKKIYNEGIASLTDQSGLQASIEDLKNSNQNAISDLKVANQSGFTDLKGSILDPVVDVAVLSNATINAPGNSDNIDIKGSKHVDVLIVVGTPTGSPDVTFHLNVIEQSSGEVIRTYDGNQLTAAGTDYITMDDLTSADYINISWDGTLDTSSYFDGCYVRVITKR